LKTTGREYQTSFCPHVFEIFRQADASSARRQGAWGSASRWSNNLLNCTVVAVSAESEGVGAGARFTVWLPLYKRAECPGLAPEPTGATGALRQEIYFGGGSTQGKTDGHAWQVAATWKAPLSSHARSGAEALGDCAAQEFDLVVSGYFDARKWMGISSCKSCASCHLWQMCPAVALTWIFAPGARC